ncbi:hypothetical protein IWZ00DRAFT_223990 [Phyllosticta capitalensis]|uniref:Secreted protein n=1 Tax=Phyllosticta capitalensis TaxID=121624 RepID=A0ABR1YRT4_9PEZI
MWRVCWGLRCVALRYLSHFHFLSPISLFSVISTLSLILTQRDETHSNASANNGQADDPLTFSFLSTCGGLTGMPTAGGGGAGR